MKEFLRHLPSPCPPLPGGGNGLRGVGDVPGDREGERGIVLLVVLVVVALLTIIVTEFTFSVRVDQHRARNAVHALQATVLARSGVNIAQSFIALDDPPAENKYDSRNDEWVLLMNEFFTDAIEVGDGMRVRPVVEDESGKININLSNPRMGSNKGRNEQQGSTSTDAYVRDAMRVIFQNQNIDLDIIDSLPEYWAKETREGNRVTFQKDFGSLEEFAAEFRIPTRKLNRLRRVLTALPVQQGDRNERKLNINTASQEVLNALFFNLPGGGGDATSAVLDKQSEDPPFQNDGEIGTVLSSAGVAQEAINALRQILGVKSNLYRIRAGAVVNANFEDEESTGGIGQTLTVLVRRKATKLPKPETGKPGWTFDVLDWQKEGGARLEKDEPGDEEEDEFGPPSDDEDEDEYDDDGDF